MYVHTIYVYDDMVHILEIIYNLNKINDKIPMQFDVLDSPPRTHLRICEILHEIQDKFLTSKRPKWRRRSSQ